METIHFIFVDLYSILWYSYDCFYSIGNANIIIIYDNIYRKSVKVDENPFCSIHKVIKSKYPLFFVVCLKLSTL
jgi:hypothetical protein